MIVVRVELWSAITGEKTELARMHICNTGGGTRERGDYQATAFRGRDSAALDRRVPQRTGAVLAYPRLKLHVWNLVARALSGMGYGQ